MLLLKIKITKQNYKQNCYAIIFKANLLLFIWIIFLWGFVLLGVSSKAFFKTKKKTLHKIHWYKKIKSKIEGNGHL